MSNDSFSSSVRGEIVSDFKRIETLQAQKQDLKDLVLSKLLKYEIAELEHHLNSLEALVSNESAMRKMWSDGAKPRKPGWLKFKEELEHNAEKRTEKITKVKVSKKEKSDVFPPYNEDLVHSVDDELETIKRLDRCS